MLKPHRPKSCASEMVRLLQKINKDLFLIQKFDASFLWTQFLVGAPFVWITASVRCDTELISLWLWWGGMTLIVTSWFIFLLAAHREPLWGSAEEGLLNLIIGTMTHFSTIGRVAKYQVLMKNDIIMTDRWLKKTQLTNIHRRHGTCLSVKEEELFGFTFAFWKLFYITNFDSYF